MTSIYHITSMRNLPNILKEGRLWCDRIVQQRSLAFISIAHQHIKDRRTQKQVLLPPGGVVADYVPFYFAPRSPMLYVINKGGVKGYMGGQGSILHLVSSAETVLQAGLPFIFTDGHAEMDISRFFTDLKDLKEIDWKIMHSHYWADILEDGDRTRRRQAEFLVHQFFPFHLFEAIGVMNPSMARQVSGLLQPLAYTPDIQVEPTWYY
jgi:hypothetical protein